MSFLKNLFSRNAPPLPPIPPDTTPKAWKVFISLVDTITKKPGKKVKSLVGDLFEALTAANVDMKKVLGELRVGVVEDAVPQTTTNKEIAGICLLWLSAVYLTYAERTRDMRQITKQWIMSGERKESPMWQDCARQAKGFARIALRYLGNTSKTLIDNIVVRAEQQEAVSVNTAKNAPRFKVELETITAPPFKGVSVFPDWIFALDRCSLTVEDILATINTLECHHILIKHLPLRESLS